MYVLDVFRLAHQFRIGLGGNQRFKSRSIALLVDVLYAKLHIFILFLLLRLSLFQIRLRLVIFCSCQPYLLQGIITYQKAPPAGCLYLPPAPPVLPFCVSRDWASSCGVAKTGVTIKELITKTVMSVCTNLFFIFSPILINYSSYQFIIQPIGSYAPLHTLRSEYYIFQLFSI